MKGRNSFFNLYLVMQSGLRGASDSWWLYLFCLLLILSPRMLFSQATHGAAVPALGHMQQEFLAPPDNCRIMMRWWWFGTAVTKPELMREIEMMKAGGIGGFEIQPVYPLALNDVTRGIQNLPYLSSGFLDALRFAADEGRVQGMRVDLTLTSGWPYGGAYVPISHAAGMLRVVRAPIKNAENSIAVPYIEEGEKLLAAFRVAGDGTDFRHIDPKQIPLVIQNGRLQVPVTGPQSETVLFFISSRTGQIVKRAAVGASGFVLDHYDRAEIEDHLHTVGDRLMQAFGTHPPYAVFSDSLEVFDSDWTPDFLHQFQQRRGYDLTPYLPALVGNIGPSTQSIRHDWGQTLTELVNQNYLAPIHAWAEQHGTRFRAQNYGVPPVILSSYSLVDIPEGENYRWREFSETRWASSASHLYDRHVTSAETWTWLHSPAFRATPLDMKAEADLDFLNGINQLIGHGWPYSLPSVGEPGWHFYAAGAWNNHNPWWFVMPEIARYLQRISYVLRLGKPENDIAILLPTDDAWANFTTTRISVSKQMKALLGPNLIPQVLDAGFNFDYIDEAAIAKVGIPYRVLILPNITRISLSTYRRIQEYKQRGGIVIATRRLPSTAPGFLNSVEESKQIQQISRLLFSPSNARGRFVANERDLASTLSRLSQPDVVIVPQTQDIGFVHRKLPDADIYFIANTSNQPREFQARFRVLEETAEWWDPDSGKIELAGSSNLLHILLQPYGARILVFSHENAGAFKKAVRLIPVSGIVDLSEDWKVHFLGEDRVFNYQHLHSWTTESSTRFYSGEVAYNKVIVVPESMCEPDTTVYLDFGSGVPVIPKRSNGPGMQALLESPIREAAKVYINGKPVGSLWHPPYHLDVTRFVQPGRNQLRIIVGNLAINEMAGYALPDYRLLNSRYGKRLEPQGMNDIHPIASWLLGQIRLIPYHQVLNEGGVPKKLGE